VAYAINFLSDEGWERRLLSVARDAAIFNDTEYQRTADLTKLKKRWEQGIAKARATPTSSL
jgi:hypothetical protein